MLIDCQASVAVRTAEAGVRVHQHVRRRRHLTFQQFFGRFGRLLLGSLPFKEVQHGAAFVHVALNQPRCWRSRATPSRCYGSRNTPAWLRPGTVNEIWRVPNVSGEGRLAQNIVSTTRTSTTTLGTSRDGASSKLRLLRKLSR
jgi:hypothetical protein